MNKTEISTLIFVILLSYAMGLTVGHAIGDRNAKQKVIQSGAAEFRVNPTNGVTSIFYFTNSAKVSQ